ncbi:epoxide hydrolase N-terminal domain-containing protein [Kribbella sp. NPDC049174]|uniref:epoxide hydrolase N-terminal domain-containing protein n=1 Tax=Kribbella sp. NPDC049174 TaxID=3364112 RepID=UPI00371DD5F4
MERVAAVRRVRLRVGEGELAGLVARVREVKGSGQGGGGVVPAEFVDELIDYWVGGYDWRIYEDRLNGYEHFATEIGGQFVHFMHSRAGRAEASAVLLTHVWPSGVLDVVDSAGGLRSTHHLVMPSIAFTALAEPGGLMRRLGYDEFVVRDDRGGVPAAGAGVTAERREFAPEELAEVRWFNENLNAVNDEQQVRALVLSAAMLAWNSQHADRDAILTGVTLAWFAPRLHAE